MLSNQVTWRATSQVSEGGVYTLHAWRKTLKMIVERPRNVDKHA